MKLVFADTLICVDPKDKLLSYRVSQIQPLKVLFLMHWCRIDPQQQRLDKVQATGGEKKMAILFTYYISLKSNSVGFLLKELT